jgi:thioredoxin reductase
MPDLNAISPDTSPAFDLLTEHPSGMDYGQYLEGLAKHFQLEIEANVEVKGIKKINDYFIVNSSNDIYASKYFIWAAGEYQYPKTDSFEGEELCTHYSAINSFSDIEGKENVVIGAYESGFDTAVNLVNLGKKVTLIDDDQYLELINSDSSYSLSPFTRDRLKNDVLDSIDYQMETRVEKVEFVDGKYVITTDMDDKIYSDYKPINCTGFNTSLKHVEEFFDFKEGYPLLNDFDASEKTDNFFLVGPQVKHGSALFCFIYKYRQRFAVVAEKIAQEMKLPESKIEDALKEYKENNFYLTDLSCCDNECVC